MRRSALLLTVALFLFLAGCTIVLWPNHLVLATGNVLLSVDSGIDGSADLPLSLGQGESAKVTLGFEQSAVMEGVEVWPLITYAFPTKGVMQTVARFVNQSQVSFLLGRENATLMTVFITGFLVRIFNHGNQSIVASGSVVKLGNPGTPAGIGLLLLSAVPLWALLAVSLRSRSMLQLRRACEVE